MALELEPIHAPENLKDPAVLAAACADMAQAYEMQAGTLMNRNGLGGHHDPVFLATRTAQVLKAAAEFVRGSRPPEVPAEPAPPPEAAEPAKKRGRPPKAQTPEVSPETPPVPAEPVAATE